MPTIHELKAIRESLHGHFSRDLPPALMIQPGDTVRFQCLDANWGLEPYNGVDVHRREFPGRLPILDDGHALTGPVYIAGAKPGMTLAVQINAIEVGPWGVTMAGGWPNPWNDRLGISSAGVFHVWTLNPAARTARNQFDQAVTLRPFMGIYGMPPAEPGVHSTIPPRNSGGNIDCNLLTAGSTLYLPVAVEGGLFSTGDGHAAQGDGEVSVTAIECPVERVDLTFGLLEDMPLNNPIANTAAGWVTMGFHQDLEEAMLIALESMLGVMKRVHSLERLDALALASITVDFHITQVVNGVKGVHAVLPHGAIR